MGASTRRHIYDAGHRVFAVLMYLDGKPADFRACYTGRTCPPKPWHAVRVERDPTGAVTKNLFFDSGERLVGEIDCKKKRCFGQ
jgi:hypothetical protein